MPDTFTVPDPADVHVVDTSQTPDVPATPEVTPSGGGKPDPVSEVSKRYGGIDLSGFSDPAAAETHAKKMVEFFATAGSRGFGQPSPQPQPQPQPQPRADLTDPTDDDFEDEDFTKDDAKTAAPPKRKRVTKRERELERRLADLERAQNESVRRAQEAAVNQLANQATEYLDSLKSPKFGIEGQRTMWQQAAAQEVVRQALAVANGALQYGHQLAWKDALAIVAGSAPSAEAPNTGEVIGQEPRGTNGNLPAAKLSAQAAGGAPLPYGGLTSYTREPSFLTALQALRNS